ncbi:DUF397 domain-containing protein [Streptomyces mobaraensis]|nr:MULTISPECIES: DUF397 domain-containing protein [Streptomyces]UBI39286.1 DUF397 domain-containing protein [Streptomyces mobaraensis]UKW31867.1 DUF397 domain-containing protein [Streptomyces sp. TYQ1024]
MTHTSILAQAIWEKSSYSQGNGGQCVQFARNLIPSSGTVPVRDSKRPTERALAFPAPAWSAFVTSIKAR